MLSPTLKLKSGLDYLKIFQKVLNEQRYQAIVEKVVGQAEEGDKISQRMLVEHAQGRPTQRIEVTQTADAALKEIQRLLSEANQPVEWAVKDEIYTLDVPVEEPSE